LYPIHCLVGKTKWSGRPENRQEVVKVMFQTTRYMALNYPMEGFCEKIKDIWGRLKTEC
jgi:hypothetical protein